MFNMLRSIAGELYNTVTRSTTDIFLCDCEISIASIPTRKFNCDYNYDCNNYNYLIYYLINYLIYYLIC